MAVEIEEMSATVEPEGGSVTRAQAEAPRPQPQAVDLDTDLRRWMRRQLRLRAD